MRDIDNILYFRSDISPFLVHLTKEFNAATAKENLLKIISEEKLIPGDTLISSASYGLDYSVAKNERNEYFKAVSFTETPLSEIYCLFDIDNRSVKLEPYGLVFLRTDLEQSGVSPVIYLNNENHEISTVVCDLCKLIDSSPETAKKLLPLISFFGYRLPPYSKRDRTESYTENKHDFRWEREWRYPATNGDFEFDRKRVFLGLCPDDEIEELEGRCFDLKFIDPTKNIRRYAEKLIQVRQKFELKYSVV